MKKVFLLIFLSGLLYACNNAEKAASPDYTQYVNPFIGTADNGHTFPGACAPFGMIQASPQSDNGTWKYCSGYNYADTTLQGFVQTCLNGTGVPDLGDILILPFTGDQQNKPDEVRFDKINEKASPGYYGVTLSDFNIDVELTATEHTAFHKYTFKGDDQNYIYIDLLSGLWDKPESASEPRIIKKGEVNMPDDKTITGHNIVKAWVERQVFYAIRFDRPYRVIDELPQEKDKITRKYILGFDIKEGESVQVKIALSTVSIDGALASMEKENPAWDFEAVKESTRSKWNELLSRVEITGTDDQKTSFYTSLYHLFIQPNNIADADGKYRGVNDSISTSPSGAYYSTFSLWDTYRAAHPLYTIIAPERVDGMVQSMLAHHKIQGFLPIWTLWGKENYCMIGNHSIPVIVDAYLKGFKGFDAEEAYQAIKESSMRSHFNSDWETYDKYGYYPFDIIKAESVSRTLESAYDDYCVAQMAKALAKTEDYEYFTKRAGFYKNLFDTETNMMRAKDSQGKWRTPFNSFLLSHAYTSGGDYTEGNAWQYTWHVQHDVEGLISLMGGKTTFETKLDSLFFLSTTTDNTGFVLDVTGLIGQYAHGNEPSHHVAYLYNYVDRKDKTQQLIREIFDRFYLAKPDGLCGNDDCGQMSAWYIFSAMGFYPVNPSGGEYILGAPQIEKVSLALPDNKIFTMEAKDLSKENKYVKSVELNGVPVKGLSIHHKDIMNGGNLVFTMTDKPIEK
ncbi:GH92 family glycosyl hydrolase [Dysgonomonas sp. 520]|uniref:GH92 family glycosyl hydrolase n=1 Tax=Dysgonomonas sp. 520 TaxID=2302931 RepID=UPI0013D7BA2D|nr:GH92 family glycosyl hydrolase [Dysgonomonas sp. 520]NDW08569.1 glycoside hydrolase family 92 protein [Dysgonomonas sp. 520]